MRAATVASTVFNMLRSSESEARSAEDFMPRTALVETGPADPKKLDAKIKAAFRVAG